MNKVYVTSYRFRIRHPGGRGLHPPRNQQLPEQKQIIFVAKPIQAWLKLSLSKLDLRCPVEETEIKAAKGRRVSFRSYLRQSADKADPSQDGKCCTVGGATIVTTFGVLSDLRSTVTDSLCFISKMGRTNLQEFADGDGGFGKICSTFNF